MAPTSIDSSERVAAEAPIIDPISIDSENSLRSPVIQANYNAGGPLRVEDPNIIRRKLTGYVGFANLPQQWHKKSTKQGFNMNLMVVGESGLGKSTLVNTLFNIGLYDPKLPRDPAAEIPKTVDVQTVSADLEEGNVRLKLTVIDTPGFGDFVNNSDSWKPIVDNIDERFSAYLEMENQVKRSKFEDNRVHACVYFIQPTGHSLKPLDIQVMKKLHKKVNLVPVIAKADTLTEEELIEFKNRIWNDIKYQQIEIFEPPRYDNDDEETIAENEGIMSRVPFAIVGSTEAVTLPDGRTVRGRQYPWGIIEVDNPDHCDFVKLRQLLIKTHLEELRERTANVLYENFRTDKMAQMGVQQDHSVFREVHPGMRQEEDRAQHEARLAKMENDMKQVFQAKVQEKETKLKRSEAELFARHKEMKEKLEQEKGALEAKKVKLEQQARVIDEKKSRKGFSLR